jgi:heme oxygenase
MRRLKAFGTIILRILKELADENAYERHLLTHGQPHSGKEWRHFCEHRLKAKYSRPKCC